MLPLLEEARTGSDRKILSEMSADDATSLASRLPEPLAANVLALMEAEPAADVRELLSMRSRPPAAAS